MNQTFSRNETQPLHRLRSDDHEFLSLLRLRQADAQQKELRRWLQRVRAAQPNLKPYIGDAEADFNDGDVFIED